MANRHLLAAGAGAILAAVVILLTLRVTVDIGQGDAVPQARATDTLRECYQVSFGQVERFDVPEGYVVAGFLGHYSAVVLCRPVVLPVCGAK